MQIAWALQVPDPDSGLTLDFSEIWSVGSVGSVASVVKIVQKLSSKTIMRVDFGVDACHKS